jgi:hypothetical protein
LVLPIQQLAADIVLHLRFETLLDFLTPAGFYVSCVIYGVDMGRGEQGARCP